MTVKQQTYPIESIKECIEDIGSSYFLGLIDLIIHLVKSDCLRIYQRKPKDISRVGEIKNCGATHAISMSISDSPVLFGSSGATPYSAPSIIAGIG